MRMPPTTMWTRQVVGMMACTMVPIMTAQVINQRSGTAAPLVLPVRYDADNHWYCSMWASIQVGEPPQAIDFGMVTNEYITVPYSGICPSNLEACRYGSYDPTKSSTQQIVANGQVNNSRFVDLYNNEGNFFQEQFLIAGVKLNNVTMGLESHGSLPTLNLGQIMDFGNMTLSTKMVDQGIIPTNSYSLAMDRKAGLADGNGTLIFGGIDTRKFAGDLIRLEVFNIGYGKRRKANLGIALTSLKVGSPTGEDELLIQEAPLFMDPFPGNDYMVLPSSLANTIFTEIGDVDSRPDNANDGIPTVRCDKASPDAYLAFQLHGTSGPVIRIPLADYFVPLNYTLGLPKKGPDFDPRRHGGLCSLMIRTNINPDGPTSKNWLVELGETFLRNAYMVYDFENRQIGVAPARYSTESNIVPFASRGASIPLSVPGPAIKAPVAYNISSQTFSEFPVAKLEKLLAAPGIQASTPDQSSGNKKNLTIGLGVGLSLGILAIISGAVCFWVLRRKRSTIDRSELEAREQDGSCSDTASSSIAEPTTPVSPTELDADPPTRVAASPEPKTSFSP